MLKSSRGPYWVAFCAAPSVLLGVWVMRRKGIPSEIWRQNLATLVIALMLCFAVAVVIPLWRNHLVTPRFVMAGVLCALALTFYGGGLQGVHRWIDFRSVRIHVAEALLPIFLLGLTSASASELASAWILTAGVAAVLIFQPDAAQGTAFIAAAALFLASRSKIGCKGACALCVLILCSVAILWMRRDPLGSVPYVEGILGLAFDVGKCCGVLAIICMVLALVPFALLYLYGSGFRPAALVLLIYFSLSMLICLSGKFPVILMGYGFSPFLGYYVVISWAIAEPGPPGETRRHPDKTSNSTVCEYLPQICRLTSTWRRAPELQ